MSQNGVDGLLTCSIRPSGIWGRGDQTMFRKVFESVLAGHVKVLVGSKNVKLDNSYVHNLIHGFILAAEHLVPGGTAPGQAYFINDGEPINMFEFSRPVVEACGQPWPKLRVPGRLVWFVMTAWQWFHFRFGLPKPLLEPLAVERLYLDNYFSIAKAQRDLGYQPLFTTERAMAECLPVLRRPLPPDEGSRCAARARLVAIWRHGSSASGLISPVALLTRAARSSRARSGSTSITAVTTSGQLGQRRARRQRAVRQPDSRPVVLVQFGAGGGDRLDDPLLTRHEVGAHAREQPRAAAPEQPDPVEAEVHGFSPADGGQRIGHRRRGPTGAAPHRTRAAHACPWVCERRLPTPCSSTRSHNARTARSDRRSNSRQTARATGQRYRWTAGA